MIDTSDFKTGLTILYNGNIYQIMDFQHVKPGKGQAFVKTKLKNLRTGANIEYSFNAGEKREWEQKFLIEGMTVEIVFYGSEILGVNLPEKMALEVTESSPAVAGNTATNALKEVTVETGLKVKVPMFINQGDKIVVTTWDGKYSERAK